MSKAQKILDQMRNNPNNWRIKDLKKVAKRHGVNWRQKGTNHVTFQFRNGRRTVAPADIPIKPIYVKNFIKELDRFLNE